MPQRQQYYAAGPQEGGVIGRSMRGGNNGQEPDPPKQDPPPPPKPPPPLPEPPPAPETKPTPPPPDGGQVPPPSGGEAGLPPEPDPVAPPGDDIGFGSEGYDHGYYWDEFGDEKYGWRPPGVGSVFNAARDPNAPIDLGDFRYKDLYGEVYWDRMTDNPGFTLGWQPEDRWLPDLGLYSDPGTGDSGGTLNWDVGAALSGLGFGDSAGYQ
jgi:hypothetical protein